MASDQSPEQLGPLIVRAVACCESLAAQLKGARALAASAGPHRPSSHRAPIHHPDLGAIPTDLYSALMNTAICRRGATRDTRSAAQRVDEGVRVAAIAARRALRCMRSARYACVSAPDKASLSPAVADAGGCLQSARPSRPIRTPAMRQPPTHRIGSRSSAAPRTSSSASAKSLIVSASYPASSASSTRRRAGLYTA